MNDKDRKKHKEEHRLPNRKKTNGELKADVWDCESGDYIICDTRDLVKIGVRADVFYSISRTLRNAFAISTRTTLNI